MYVERSYCSLAFALGLRDGMKQIREKGKCKQVVVVLSKRKKAIKSRDKYRNLPLFAVKNVLQYARKLGNK